MENFFRYGAERFSRYTSTKKNYYYSVLKFLFSYHKYQLIKQKTIETINTLAIGVIYFALMTPIKFMLALRREKRDKDITTYWLDADKHE